MLRVKVENLRKSHLETLFNLLQNLLVLVAADERDGESLGAEPTGTTNTVQIRAGIGGQIVVDGQVDALDIDATAKHISGNTDALLELLELLVALDAVFSSQRPNPGSKEKLGWETYRSSWLTPEWTAIEGKLHSRRSLSSSVARMVLLTKMITWLN